MSESHLNSDLTNVMGNGNNSPWPGGWYVFEDGRVQGPFTADAAFAMPERSPAGSPKLVSRKGFSQWYPLKDLSELYRIADKLGHRTSNEVDRLEAEVTENLANLEVLRALAQTGADPSVIARTPRVVGKSIDSHQMSGVRPASKDSHQTPFIDPHNNPTKEFLRATAPERYAEFIGDSIAEPAREVTHEKNAAEVVAEAPGKIASVSVTEEHTPVQSGPARRTMGRKERKAMARRAAQQKAQESEKKTAAAIQQAAESAETIETKFTGQTAQGASTAAPQANAASGMRKLTAKQALLQEYLMLRGRLRLGEMRSPFVSAFLLAPLTLFIYWGVWYRDLTRELTWHTRNNSDMKSMPNTWLAWIPIIHIFMAYRLAGLVREAEVQNGYKAVSPLIAGIFAIIPPLAMAYIQDSANQHWRLHVKHSIIDRMGQ